MTTREAARLMGCTQKHLGHLIRSGVITACKRPMPTGFGYWYDVSQESVDWYEQRVSSRGWPRGKARRAKR
jgi:hypothetical protein